jgi:hypothetical protein
MRVTSVQLGGSLAGKLSSKLSSILSSDVAAAGGSGWRLRRGSADPRRCGAMDRGIMSPADSRHSHKYSRSTRPTRLLVLMIHLPLAPAHGLRTPSGLSRWPKPIHGPAHWSKRAFPSADQPPPALRPPNAAEPRSSPPRRRVFVTPPDMRPARGRRPGVAPRCRSSRSGRSRPHSRGRRWQAQRGRSARPGAPSDQPA